MKRLHANSNFPFVTMTLMVLAFVVFAVSLTPTIVSCFATLNPDDPIGKGEFGDQFGATNALFSGLAFGAVVITLILQYQELRLQRKDIQDSKITAEIQARQLELQANSMRRQAFESVFFRTLDILRNQRDSFHLAINNRDFGSRNASITFSPQPSDLYKDYKGIALLERLVIWIRERERNLKKTDPVAIFDIYKDAYKTRFINSLGAYMRILYRLLKTVDQEYVSYSQHGSVDSEKIQMLEYCLKIVRAQMSDAELVLVFLNGHTELGQRMKPLADKYRLFDNMSPSVLGSVRVWDYSDSSFIGIPGSLSDPFRPDDDDGSAGRKWREEQRQEP